MDVERLVGRARGGDAEAFEALFETVADRVRLFVRLRLGPGLRARVEPDDLLQDACLAAFQAFPTFEWRGETAFARWLCRLVENQVRAAADHHGAAKRRAPGPVLRISAVADAARASATGPATAAVRAERHARLADALGRLPADEREALLLHHFQDRTVDEIAALTGRSRSAAGRLLGRATTRLGALLREEDADV